MIETLVDYPSGDSEVLWEDGERVFRRGWRLDDDGSDRVGPFCCGALVRSWHIASFAAARQFGRFRSKADMDRPARLTRFVENDPNRSSGGQFYCDAQFRSW